MQTMFTFIKRFFSTVCFIGYFPKASGTIASMATVGVLYYFMPKVAPYFLPASLHLFWPVYVAFVGFAIFVSNGAKEMFGAEDPSAIVIDEVAGQLITFMGIALTPGTLLFGLVLFRFFDIVKPFPIHKFEEMDDGCGIVMDDVAAGVLANISLLVILWGYHALKAHLN